MKIVRSRLVEVTSVIISFHKDYVSIVELVVERFFTFAKFFLKSRTRRVKLSKFVTFNRWFVSWNFRKESSKFSLDNYNVVVLFLDWSEFNNDLQNLFYFIFRRNTSRTSNATWRRNTCTRRRRSSAFRAFLSSSVSPKILSKLSKKNEVFKLTMELIFEIVNSYSYY